MHINLIWSATALAAPQGVRDAIAAAATILDATFTNPITLNIEVGYGVLTVNGKVEDTLASGVSEGGPDGGGSYQYAGIPSFLASQADSTITGALDGLPMGTAIGSHDRIILWSAQQKALGLIAPNDSALDGAVGFATNFPSNYLQGAALHELTHALGRSTSDDGTPTVFDLYRYTAPGQNLFGNGSTAPPAYFSLDGGQTSLAAYGQTSDPSDFLKHSSQTPNDALNETWNSATVSNLSAMDLLQMQALGFNVAGVIPGEGYDFAGPGQAALAFRDYGTGDWGFMSPSPSGVVWHAVGPTSVEYMPIAVGDFNGDRLTDIAFRDTLSGDWGFMTANPSGGESWQSVGPTSNAYAAIAVGDFAGSGHDSIMFRDSTTGDMGYMSANPSGGESWYEVGPTSIAYQPVGVADFNNDGTLDLAFFNPSTYDWGYMSINRAGGETWHEVGQVAPKNLGAAYDEYQVLGVGDFLGDGRNEVAVRDTDSGQWAIIFLTNPGLSLYAFDDNTNITSMNYVAVAIGKFSGDGRSDIMFRNTNTGDLGYMEMTSSGGEIWHSMGPTSPDYFAI